MSRKKPTLIRSFRHALRGVGEVFITERSMRIHTLVALIAVALIAWLDLNKEASALIIFAIGAVITTEVINTAIEKLLDHIHPEEHDAVRFIKDAMAGAVLVSSLAALSIGIVLVLPELIKRLTP